MGGAGRGWAPQAWGTSAKSLREKRRIAGSLSIDRLHSDVAEIALTPKEESVAKRCKAKKLFVFLRMHRHELFDEALQEELAGMYGDQPPGGSEAVAPALLAMVTILQAAFGTSDADAVEEAAMNGRWQLVLGCLGAEDAPFSQGTLQKFRQRLIAHDMDKRLLDRTVALARGLGGFGHRNLRAAFDASPLFGAGRVEDKPTVSPPHSGSAKPPNGGTHEE